MVTTRRGKKETSKPVASPAASRATASQRVKNKVGSPVAKRKPDILPPPPSPLQSEAGYSTDKFDLDDEEDPEKARPRSDSLVSSTASKRERLPGHVLCQLAANINEKGGIEKFWLESEQSLALLCDNRPELYGVRGSRLRYRVGKKVDCWKGKVKINPLAWLQILEDLQVTKKATKKQLKKVSSKSSEQGSKRDKADGQEQSKQGIKRDKAGEREHTEQGSKKAKAVDPVFSPHTFPSTVSVPNETMADDEGMEDHFPPANVDPDLHVPLGAELSKYLCSGLSSELSHCTAF